jgi:hypothetical protein
MKRYYKKETQREHDEILHEARVVSRFANIPARERQAKAQRERDIAEGRAKERHASLQGVKARMLWATKNQRRLVRVFV